jgi:acyl-CoA synthetase (AMP-forming)/AMP-acid ligase II
MWRTLEAEGVDALSCTATFADLLIQNEPANGGGWSPKQITLGGEPLRERTGARLRDRWPDARTLAIYAAAEFGVLLKTSRTDGWYEIEGLEERRWRVAPEALKECCDSSQLLSMGGHHPDSVESPESSRKPSGGNTEKKAAMNCRSPKARAGGVSESDNNRAERDRQTQRVGPEGGRIKQPITGVLEIEVEENGQREWRSTGDRVEVDWEAGLMRVVGRADDVANVAGTKVSLAEVAAAAEEVPGVRRAVAVAVDNPVTGQVVGLRFALEDGADEGDVRRRMEDFLRGKLPKPAWPRDWRVDEVGVGVNAKRG